METARPRDLAWCIPLWRDIGLTCMFYVFCNHSKCAGSALEQCPKMPVRGVGGEGAGGGDFLSRFQHENA